MVVKLMKSKRKGVVVIRVYDGRKNGHSKVKIVRQANGMHMENEKDAERIGGPLITGNEEERKGMWIKGLGPKGRLRRMYDEEEEGILGDEQTVCYE